MGRSSIEWTNFTFNVWRGCTKATWVDAQGKTRLHPGCLNCYAEADMSVKLDGIKWGKGQERRPKAESGWKEPMRWARAAAKAGERHRVFCASLADVLDPEVPDAERLWNTIRRTAEVGHAGVPCRLSPAHIGHDDHCRWGLDWLLLTKRPEEWQRIPADVRSLVWLGTSVSDQETADEWVPRLLAAEGFRCRFLSVEPLVGPVDLHRWLPWIFRRGIRPNHDGTPFALPAEGGTRGIDWVICGGESGPKARPCNVEWIRSIVHQCREAGVPCHVKQLGSVWASDNNAMTWADKNGGRVQVPDSKGGDWNNWPADLRVREFPGGAP